MTEVLSDYRRRDLAAKEKTRAHLGPEPRHSESASAVAVFFATSLPAYFALLLAGYSGEKLQIPLIATGVISAAATYLYIRSSTQKWYSYWSDQMMQTKPVERIYVAPPSKSKSP